MGRLLAGMSVDPEEAELHSMSTLTEEGVMAVKQIACDRLLASRVEMKLQVCHPHPYDWNRMNCSPFMYQLYCND